MWAGTQLSKIQEFIAQNDFDILCLQEVSGIGAIQGNITATREGYMKDSFTELQQTLRQTHHGQLAIAQYMASDPKRAYFGNAILYKKDFLLKDQHILPLFSHSTPFPTEATSYEEVGRNVLHLTLEKDGKTINVVSAHLAWAKTKEEQPHQREQNKKLIAYMQQLATPWVLTGDFNIDPNQQSIVDLEALGKDLTKTYNIPNTIDPTFHRNWEKIKPGFPIDYIFVSPDVQVNDFRVLENIHLSDHLGLTATLLF